MGADITVGGGGGYFMARVGEPITTLHPPTQHPQAADGKDVQSVRVSRVRLSLVNVTLDENVHILPDIRRLLLSWAISRRLQLIPDDYPRQISAIRSPLRQRRRQRRTAGRGPTRTQRSSTMAHRVAMLLCAHRGWSPRSYAARSTGGRIFSRL